MKIFLSLGPASYHQPFRCTGRNPAEDFNRTSSSITQFMQISDLKLFFASK